MNQDSLNGTDMNLNTSSRFSDGKPIRQGDDLRTVITRFSKENMNRNQLLIDLITHYAAEKHCIPAQISLAWDLMAYESLVPIPGMRREERVIENLGASDVAFTFQMLKNAILINFST